MSLSKSLDSSLTFDADLAVAIQDGVPTYRPGAESVYTVIITNDGADDAAGTRVVAPLPTGVSSANWTAQYSPGATGPASGSESAGNAVFATIGLPAGGSAIFTVTAPIEATAVADITLEVEARAGLGVTDSDLTNNTVADANTRDLPLVVAGAGIGYRSTPTVTVIDPVSGQEVNQFLAFEPPFRGGVSTALADVDEDGSVEIIAASGPGKGEVRVFELDGTELSNSRLRPFGDAYFGGLSIAYGDFDGDGRGDIAAGKSRGADVAVFGLAAGGTGWAAQPTQTFQPYGGSHINGVVLAAADIGVVAGGVIQDATVADRQHELVVGTGAGASRSVQVMSLEGGAKVLRKIAPKANYRVSGVVVAAARFNGDPIDDIFVSSGRGSSALTEVFSGLLPVGGGVLQRFAAPADSFGTNARSYASGIDLDGDGQVDQVYSLSEAGSSRGAAVFDRAGSQTNTLDILRGPLHLARSVTPTPVIDQTLVTTASGLQYRDLLVGSGSVATADQSVTVQYVGSRQNGEVFDSSRGRGTPFSFRLGLGTVIAGWDEGVAGMRVGGRRQLIIPADLAYGDNPPGSIIQPGDTLVFDINLLSADSTGIGVGDVNAEKNNQMVDAYGAVTPVSGSRFHTQSKDEKNSVISSSTFDSQYEGVEYEAPGSDGTQLYLFLNEGKGYHFMTASSAEADVITGNPEWGYKYEGRIFGVSPTDTEAAPTEVFRFYNPEKGVHFYSASLDEANNVIANSLGAGYNFENAQGQDNFLDDGWGFVYEGIAWYGVSGETSLGDITFVRQLDKSSPKLFEATPLDFVTIHELTS